MDWKLEVVVVPVTDIDRAKQFYLDKMGFKLDADTQPAENFRVVHMTPPGSACSVVIGPAVVSPGTDLGASARMQLIVTDIDAARAELSGRGVQVSDVQVMDARDGGKFFFLTDPDGNNWAVQEVREYVGAPPR
jgi:catechol 2,3-dioxygenase-like lactoylglutathione lyase family enzyme